VGPFACSLAVLLASGGVATKTMETTLQDDALFLHRPAGEVAETAQRVAQLGADRVRLTAGWSVIAPDPQRRTKPGKPFDAADSRTYPDIGWERLDKAIRASDRAGLATQIDLAFWAPRWAVKSAARDRARHRDRPDPQAFGEFATAAAKRYNGTFPDPENRKRAGVVYGPQCEVARNETGTAGRFYDEGRRGKWLDDIKPEAKHAFEDDGWNRYRIVVQGDRYRSWVNGVAASDFTDDVDKGGFIGLQVHGIPKGQGPYQVRWRNIRIRELKPDEVAPEGR